MSSAGSTSSSLRTFSLVTPEGLPVLARDGGPMTFRAKSPCRAARRAFFVTERIALWKARSAGQNDRVDASSSLPPGDILPPASDLDRRAFDAHVQSLPVVPKMPDPPQRAEWEDRYWDALCAARASQTHSPESSRVVCIREFGRTTIRQYECGYKLNLQPNWHELQKQIVRVGFAQYLPKCPTTTPVRAKRARPE